MRKYQYMLLVLGLSVCLTGCQGQTKDSAQEGTAAAAEESSSETESVLQFDNQSLVVIAQTGTDLGTMEALAAEYEAEIVDSMEEIDYYQLGLSGEHSYQELTVLCDTLETEENILDAHVNLYDIFPQSGSTLEEDIAMWESILAEGMEDGALEAVNGLDISEYAEKMQPVKVGIMDYPVDYSHEDLEIANAADYSVEHINSQTFSEAGHGTQIAGVIGAKAGNGIGIDGVSSTAQMYSYNAADQSVSERTKQLVQMIAGEQVRVINFSIAYPTQISVAAHLGNANAQAYVLSEAEYYTQVFIKLLDKGYDFLICQGAGNENGSVVVENSSEHFGYSLPTMEQLQTVTSLEDLEGGVQVMDMDAGYAFFTSAITEPRVKEHIIVVGACDSELQLAPFSNIGSRVDLVAPGMMVLSTYPLNSAVPANGTSIAAPFVTGTAACMYAMNPELTAPEIKEAIIASSRQKIADTYPLLDVKAAISSVSD